jgi:hypothetical protein
VQCCAVANGDTLGAMTDLAASGPSRTLPLHQRYQNLILVVAGAVMVAVAAAIVYSFAGSGNSKTMELIKTDVQGQLVTQDVSCRKIGFSAPDLTKQQIYACDAKNVAQPNRPNGHIRESAFTRCYIRAVNGQTVDVSHAVSIEATRRGASVPCR